MSSVKTSKKAIDQQQQEQISGTQTSILNENNVQNNQLEEKRSSSSNIPNDDPLQSEQQLVQQAQGQSTLSSKNQIRIENPDNLQVMNNQNQEQGQKEEADGQSQKEIIPGNQIQNNIKDDSQKAINLSQKQMELKVDSQRNQKSQLKGQEQADSSITSQPTIPGSNSKRKKENLQSPNEESGVDTLSKEKDGAVGSPLDNENNQNIDNSLEKQQSQRSSEDSKADPKSLITPIKVGTQTVRRVVHIPKLQSISRDTKQYPPHQQKSQKQDSKDQKQGSNAQLLDKLSLEKESSQSTEKQISPRREKQNNNSGIYSHLSGISPRRDDKFKNTIQNNNNIGSTSEQVMKMELDNAYKLIEVIKKDNKQLQSRAYDISQYEKMNSMESELRTKDAEIKNLKREMEIIKRAQRVGPGEEEKRQLQIKRTEDYTERYALKQKIKELQEKIVEQDDKFTKQLVYLRQHSNSVDKSGNGYQPDLLSSPGKRARRNQNGSLSLQPANSSRTQPEENVTANGQLQPIQSNYQMVESYSLERNVVKRKIPTIERSLSPKYLPTKFNNLQVIKDQQQQGGSGYAQKEQLTLAQQMSNDSEFNNIEFNEVNFYDVIQRAKVYKKSRDSFSKKLNLEVAALKSQVATLKQEALEMKQQLVVKDRKISSLQSQMNLLQRQKIQQQNSSLNKLLGSDRKISTEIAPEQLQYQQQQARYDTEGAEAGNELYDVQITPVKQRKSSDFQEQSQGKISSASARQLKNLSARSINSVESMKNLKGLDGEENQGKQVLQLDSITPKAIFPTILPQISPEESKQTSERKQSVISDRKQQNENSSRKISVVGEKRYSETIEATTQERKQSILGLEAKAGSIGQAEEQYQEKEEQEQLKSSSEIQKSSSSQRHSSIRASIGRKSISGSSQKSALSSSSAFSETKPESVEKKTVFDESNSREVQVGVNEPQDESFSDKSLLVTPSVIVAVRVQSNEKGISSIQCDYRTLTTGAIINAPIHVSGNCQDNNKNDQEFDQTIGDVSLNLSATQNKQNPNDQSMLENSTNSQENGTVFDVRASSSEDYLKYIQGTIDCETNCILQLSLISALGLRSNLGIKDLQPGRAVASVQHFLMDIKEDEVPRCLYGAITSDGRLTLLGFVVEKLTIEEKIERSTSQNQQRIAQNDENSSIGQIGKSQSIIEQKRQSSAQSQKKEESQKEISASKSKNDMLSESGASSKEQKQKSSTSIRSVEQEKSNESEKKKKSVMDIQLNLDSIQIHSEAAAGGGVEQKSSEGKIVSGSVISDSKIGITTKDKS